MTARRLLFGLALVSCGLVAVWSRARAQEEGGEAPAAVVPEVPAGLGKMKVPKDNPLTAEKIALGRQLYWDPRLSQDMTISCATCHHPEHGWSNNADVATGFGGQKGGRNSPTILNSAFNSFQFWDGRSPSLEDQALGPMQNPIEMAMTVELVEERINAIPGYTRQFKEVFGTEEVTAELVAKAIAAYERTILSGNAPYDQFKAGDEEALSDAARRGMDLFFGKARCSACHSGPHFTDGAFHNIGIGFDEMGDTKDVGRNEISKLGGDKGAFKTPTLREIARSAPYMHDGSEKTLLDVVKYYNRGGNANTWLDEEIAPLKLTDAEMQDLVTFMQEGLASESYPMHEEPGLPE